MVRDPESRIRKTTPLLLTLMAVCLLASSPAATAPRVTPCYDVRIEFRGREATQNINNIQYYRWTYRIYGGSCINRALSNWMLQICASTRVSGISTLSIDASDPARGLQTQYLPTLGNDPNGVYVLKWDELGGNPIDKSGEYDEFSFIASGPITTMTWWSKGSGFVVSGTTQGPGCLPVPNGNLTWGDLKSRY